MLVEAARILPRMSAFSASILRPQAGNKAFIAEIVQLESPSGTDLLYLVGGTYHKPTLLVSSDAVHFYKRPTPDKPGLRSLLVTGERMYVCGEYGGLFVSEDNAKTWDEIETDTNACLFALTRDVAGALWVVGDEGFVMRSEDGDDWEAIDIGYEKRIQSVYSINDTLWFACEDALIRRDADGSLTTVLETKAPLTDMILSTKHGFFVSGDKGQLWRSTDRGESFEPLKVVGEDIDLEAVAHGPGGVFVVGSKGTILHSTDGAKFAFIEVDSRDHFFSASPAGGGVLVGGEGGILVHAKPEFDHTWEGKADTLAEVAGELDALFRETSPDAFVIEGLPKLLNVPAPTIAPNAAFEANWGVALPDEINAFLQLVEHKVERALYEWRPENDLLPNLPPEENLFEWIVKRDQGAYLGTGLPEIFCGQVCLGSYGNGDTHQASIYGAKDMGHDGPVTPDGPRTMLIFDHEEHRFAFETATSVNRLAYMSALAEAMTKEKVSESAANECLEKLRGTIHPSWHFSSTFGDERVEELSYEDKLPYGRIWYARGVWLIYLLRADGVVEVEDVKRMFFPNHNPVLAGDVHERWRKSAARLVPTAIYCLLRCFYFDDPKLGEYLQIARKHKARIVRDLAALVDDTLAGKRTALGKIPDWLAQRKRFQKLDLDPARAEARKQEAAERAAAAERARAEVRAKVEAALASGGSPTEFAWDALEDVEVHKVVENALRESPALAATFTSLDYVLSNGWSRENLILEHEKREEIEWLALHGDASVVPLLLGALMRPAIDRSEEKEAPKPVPVWMTHPNLAGELLEAFAERGRLDARATPALRKLLEVEEKYQWRRTAAVTLLGQLRDVESLPKLQELAAGLPTPDMIASISRKELGKAIAEALGRLGDARAIPTLAALLTGSDRSTEDYRSEVGVALGELGAVEHWKDVLAAATRTDRGPTCWLLWALGTLGAKADAATKKAIVAELETYKPRWGSTAIDIVRTGVMARLGAPPDDFGQWLEKAFTTHGWDEKMTEAQQEWAMRIVGVTDASTAPLLPFLLRDKPSLRHTARTALAQRGEAIPPVKMLGRAEAARIEAEGGVPALIAALEDERAIFKHVVAGRLGVLGAQAARPALVHYARKLLATCLPEVGFKTSNDIGYGIRWTLKALLQLGPSPELTALLADLLAHESRDVKDPALRYAKELPDEPALIVPMLQVADEKWGWQESTAKAWLDEAKKKHPDAYKAATSRQS